jgi:hypothetical protein
MGLWTSGTLAPEAFFLQWESELTARLEAAPLQSSRLNAICALAEVL